LTALLDIDSQIFQVGTWTPPRHNTCILGVFGNCSQQGIWSSRLNPPHHQQPCRMLRSTGMYCTVHLPRRKSIDGVTCLRLTCDLAGNGLYQPPRSISSAARSQPPKTSAPSRNRTRAVRSGLRPPLPCRRHRGRQCVPACVATHHVRPGASPGHRCRRYSSSKQRRSLPRLAFIGRHSQQAHQQLSRACASFASSRRSAAATQRP